ncbi:methyltransferase domain-containing protein [Spirosoma sp. HMF4905]|uniref:Methyltransferase domain-containing protein n=1 Tax=Spirosoma arboris TaxID=2682092 RepID=A0A7K1SAU0_9BACT|nr:class I SAM-dependent methyltransferase [Spirosoma arboris]MVM30919.1 methyltransferase domain-containing protein [Spirosoma arboris]
MNQFLDFLAKTHSTYLHAKGEIATEHLINWLDCKPGERILEFGVGTGGTLIKVVSRYPQTIFCGVDASDLMIDKTKKRLAFCHLKKSVVVQKIEKNQLDCFADNYFDKIYIESVLGIQSGNDLMLLLTLFGRILKPSGKLFLNETIWLNSTSLETVAQFNKFTREKFGINQACASYPYIDDWKRLLTTNQFDILRIEKVDALPAFKAKSTLNEKLSLLFTFLGRVYGKLALTHWSQRFEKAIKSAPTTQQLMEGYLIMAHNAKASS